jgi:ribonuclease P protein component
MSDATPHRRPRLRFTHAMRLHGAKAFRAVYSRRMRAAAGYLTVYSVPNGLAFNRLGLSVPRAGGTAIRRNRIKRRMREAFRRAQLQLPTGYDLAIRVRPHEPRTVVEYESSLKSAVRKLHQLWSSTKHHPQA